MDAPNPKPDPPASPPVQSSGLNLESSTSSLGRVSRSAFLKLVYAFTGFSVASLGQFLYLGITHSASDLGGGLAYLFFVFPIISLAGASLMVWLGNRFLSPLPIWLILVICAGSVGILSAADSLWNQHELQLTKQRNEATALEQQLHPHQCQPSTLPDYQDSGRITKIDTKERMIAFTHVSDKGGNSLWYCDGLMVTFGPDGPSVPVEALKPGDEINLTFTNHIKEITPQNDETRFRLLLHYPLTHDGQCQLDTKLQPPGELNDPDVIGLIKPLPETVGQIKTPLYGFYTRTNNPTVDPELYAIICNNTKLTDANGKAVPLSTFKPSAKVRLTTSQLEYVAEMQLVQ